MRDFIYNIPKVELHLHIEGSLEPELLMKLAKRNGVDIAYESVEELRRAYEFDCLQDFLDIYYQGAEVLQTEEDFYDLTIAYLRRCADENIVHTEIFFDPQTHTERGVAFATIVNGISRALEEARNKWAITSCLIPCFLRHLSEEDAFETWKQAQPHLSAFTAFGLDSSEAGHPPEKFARVFEAVRQAGLKVVAHAGEEGPTDYIYQALDILKVERVDHGVRCLEDEALVKRLADEKMPLTVCPTSNIALRVFDKMTDHNLKHLIEAKLQVTINSDDPAYFGGYLSENFMQIQKAFDLDQEEIRQLCFNAVESSFLGRKEKEELFEKVRQFSQK